MTKATTVKELPSLLGGKPVGTKYLIKGYIDSAGSTKDLTVKTLGPDDYAKMKKESLELLEKKAAPDIQGFPPVMVAQARDALMTSYRTSSADNARSFKDPYEAAPEGGYSTKDGEPAVYLLRLENLTEKSKEVTDVRVDLVRAKAALVRAMDLPAGRYMHTVKLTDGKFKSVQTV